MVKSVIAPTPSCAAPSGAANPAPNRLRNPRVPIVTPIITTTNPAISGEKNGRSGRNSRETVISARPAKIVMPNISVRPPAFSARIDAGR